MEKYIKPTTAIVQIAPCAALLIGSYSIENIIMGGTTNRLDVRSRHFVDDDDELDEEWN